MAFSLFITTYIQGSNYVVKTSAAHLMYAVKPNSILRPSLIAAVMVVVTTTMGIVVVNAWCFK